MTMPATAESYWMDSAPGPSYPALVGDVEVDVAVVGAGIAGISTAWELAAAGRSVALVEADRVAAGVTGYTTAKLTALHGLIYARLRSSFDAEAAHLYARSQQAAVQHVVDTADRLGIDCDLEAVPAVTYVESADRVDEVRAEADAAAEAGLPAEFVTDTGLPFDVAGAVRVDGQVQFHPRKYLLALVANLAGRPGGRVYERSRVVSLDEGEPCTLRTETGAAIRARDVVVTTHYPVFDRALLFARLTPRREVVVAAVIDPADDPGGMYLSPEEHIRSVRTAPWPSPDGSAPDMSAAGGDGRRLLIVTGEHFRPGTAVVSERLERLADWTRRRFRTGELAYRWAAQDNDTADRLPYIGHFHPGAKHVYVATGFNGWGMSNGVAAGRLLAALIAGEEPPEAKLYDPRRLHPLVEGRELIKANLTVAGHFIGDRLRSSHVDSVDDIAPGSGAVLRIGGERCAVYRDDFGALRAVSARCTHLGCIVHFNDAERSWDCPCHGSRFGTDGSVLQGPAVEPLEPYTGDLPDSPPT
jgi:glycine/D-amino acid oxidase-like deaminating enzyme/nitrite reductase/ring-hydroxylating ferredoxin subunit